MLIQWLKKQSHDASIYFISTIVLTIITFFVFSNLIAQIGPLDIESFDALNTEDNEEHPYIISLEYQKLSSNNWNSISQSRKLEATVRCVGSVHNQSCLFTNLYYVDGTFTVLTVVGSELPNFSVRTDAFVLQDTTPKIRIFDSYSDLEEFVRIVINPKIIPSITLYFGQSWHHNIGHALFDGLYPAYVALIRFPPRHLRSFRILSGLGTNNDSWSEDVNNRFAGFGILKQSVLNDMSKGQWFIFDEIVMGSGTLCQRCIQTNLQLPGGIELDASRLFRDRMYQKHDFIPPLIRTKSSQRRTFRDVLQAFIIDSEQFTEEDRKEMYDAIHEINQYTASSLSEITDYKVTLEWPLINVTYVYHNPVQMTAASTDSRASAYEFIDDDFMNQLKLVRRMDIHVSGPGTGQMYQTFLSDGSVHINLGGIRSGRTKEAYTSYLEQQITSGTPYIQSLYYPINERPKGIKKYQIIALIREAGQMILEGFDLPVNPHANLAADGQLFIEMCEKDAEFRSLITNRTSDCSNFLLEDFVHEYRQWSIEGFIDNGRIIICPFNRTLLQELRNKYGIVHLSEETHVNFPQRNLFFPE